MDRKTVIIIEKCPNILEAWGSLKKACNAHPDFQYHSIKMLKMPFEHKGWVFHRVEFNQLSNL